MDEDRSAIAYGHLPSRRSVTALRALLRDCGLTPSEGDTHHVSVRGCSHFVFREDGKGTFLLSADAATTEELLSDAAMVSAALSSRAIAHTFEVYDADDKFIQAFTFNYPPPSNEP